MEEAGISALLALIVRSEDTNLIARGGLDGQRWAAQQAEVLLTAGCFPSRDKLEQLDREMTRRNLSPGGCADLLAITYFLHFITTQ